MTTNKTDEFRKMYYPCEAHETSEENALLHSLRKWLGLEKLTRDRHGSYSAEDEAHDYEKHGAYLAITGPYGQGRRHLQGKGLLVTIDSSSCSLCWHADAQREHPRCAPCILYQVRAGVSCDKTRGEEEISPWHAWMRDIDPKPMLKWLITAYRSERIDEPGEDFNSLWNALGDTPIDDDGNLLEDFYFFPAGTDREDVWHWFEDWFDISVAETMYGGEK